MKHVFFLIIILSGLHVYNQSVVIGTTTYALQSNGSSKNRIVVYDDGKISVTWNGSNSFASSYPDRGMYYNYFNGFSWGPVPTSRIEPVRTGFGEIITVLDHEVIVSHDGVNIRMYRNETIGGNVWTELGGSGMVSGLWPKVFCPAGTDDIYMINADNSDVNNIYFSRSKDGGETWNIFESVVPGLYDADGIASRYSDAYQLVVHGADVYILYGYSNCDLKLLHSPYRGNPGTWSSDVLIDFPINNFEGAIGQISDVDADGIPDTIAIDDHHHEMLVTNDGTVHIWTGFETVYDDDPLEEGWNYFWNVGGVWYWNSTMTDPVYLDLLIDWDNTDGLNDPIAGIGAGSWCYTGLTLTSMAGAAYDESTGTIYLLFVMPVEYTDYFGDPGYSYAESFRDLFGVYSIDNGASWSSPVNLTNTAGSFKENVFPSVYDKVIGGKIHVIWMQDNEPGTPFSVHADPIATNNIRYQAFTPEDFGAPVVCDIISPPTGLFVDGITSTSATFHWNEVPGADKYQLMINNVAVPADKFKKKPGTNSTTVTTLTPGSTYSCKVKTICPGGSMSPYSSAVLFSTPLRNGISQTALEVIPNPNNGIFTISTNGFEVIHTKIKIYNAFGNLVYAETMQSDAGISKINLQDVAPGLYFMEVSDALHSEIKKIIIE